MNIEKLQKKISCIEKIMEDEDSEESSEISESIMSSQS